jgi:hypothetical protein
MPKKIIEIDGIGPVVAIKRRGSTTIRLSYARDGSLRVSLPYWLPYKAATEFVRTKRAWIESNRPARETILQNGDKIGKAHHLIFIANPDTKLTAVRLKGLQIIVSFPYALAVDNEAVQKAAERGVLRALKKEADSLLPQRLAVLAKQHGYSYESVKTKRLLSRWGSCNHNKAITLNIYLMQLPWHLIDYVLLHELAHTKQLDHSSQFWKQFEQTLPNAKKIRKELKQYKTIPMTTLRTSLA